MNQVIIFEDDIILDKNFKAIFNMIPDLPKNWQVLLLGCNTYKKRGELEDRITIKTINKTRIQVVVENVATGYGSYGYLVNRSGAKTLLTATQKLFQSIDSYVGDYHYVSVYLIQPSLVTVDYSLSSTIDLARSKLYQRAEKNLITAFDLKQLLIYIGLFSSVKYIQRNFSIYKYKRYMNKTKR